MKIGIFTFHRAYNYGAVLQAFALKKYLEYLNNDVFFIDYWPKYHERVYKLWNWSFLSDKTLSPITKIKYGVSLFLTYYIKRRRFNKFKGFIKSYLDVINEKAIYSTGQMIAPIADMYIYGSDQIWRYDRAIGTFDPVYFGLYPKDGVKIAFSASMGVLEESSDSVNFLQNNLSNFQNISVREENLCQFIQPFIKIKVEQTLDPVFLLSAEEWKNLFGLQDRNEKYILFYNLLTPSDFVNDIVSSFSESLGYKIIEISGIVRPCCFGRRFKQNIGPVEFLDLVYNSALIISSSFHGVAFSLIFQKQFVALGMKHKGDRVKSLLKKLEIPDRYLDKEESINSLKPIDYSSVNDLLESYKLKSKDYINQVINKENANSVC